MSLFAWDCVLPPVRKLPGEHAGVGAGVGGPKALSMLDIGNPNLNWVSLAEGMGVEATAARTAEEFNVQLESALATKGPRLIEAIL